MNIAIIGYGVQGKSAAMYWRNKGTITICDQNETIDTPEWAHAKLGESYLTGLGQYDLIVRSPSVHPSVLTAAASSDILQKVTTTTNEFFAISPTKNIIGVTGTKGKGTTSSLITEILRQAGKTVHLGGNIGVDPLDMLNEGIQVDDWVVLELANFQLIDITYSPKIAVCLMVVPEHLNWHSDVAEYYESKKQLFKYQSKDDLAIYNADSSTSIETVWDTMANKIPYFVPRPPHNLSKIKQGAYCENNTIYFKDSEVCSVDDVLLRGRHNVENVCAAIAATWGIIGGNTLAIKKALASFTGLEHRIEFVKEVDGVGYFNDSFATTPEATIAAIRAFDQPKVLIVGGSDKGVSLQPVIDEILTSNIRHVIAIGVTGNAIASELLQHHYRHITTGLTTMPDIVEIARDVAKKGDVILLSTASASFGLFKDYKDRGVKYKAAIHDL